MDVQETYVVSYENEAHWHYASLCVSYGFDLTLSAKLRVGLKFVHPLKGHIVRLDLDEDETYEPHLMIYLRETYLPDGRRELPRRDDYDIPIYPQHYSDIEQQWLDRPMENGSERSQFELLARELYIWFKVRPRSMNMMVTNEGNQE